MIKADISGDKKNTMSKIVPDHKIKRLGKILKVNDRLIKAVKNFINLRKFIQS